jgi:hypothetical protein
MIRRGEGGGAERGGPLWSPAGDGVARSRSRPVPLKPFYLAARIPFFYWYQMLWILLTAIITAALYLVITWQTYT